MQLDDDPPSPPVRFFYSLALVRRSGIFAGAFQMPNVKYRRTVLERGFNGFDTTVFYTDCSRYLGLRSRREHLLL